MPMSYQNQSIFASRTTSFYSGQEIPWWNQKNVKSKIALLYLPKATHHPWQTLKYTRQFVWQDVWAVKPRHRPEPRTHKLTWTFYKHRATSSTYGIIRNSLSSFTTSQYGDNNKLSIFAYTFRLTKPPHILSCHLQKVLNKWTWTSPVFKEENDDIETWSNNACRLKGGNKREAHICILNTIVFPWCHTILVKLFPSGLQGWALERLTRVLISR